MFTLLHCLPGSWGTLSPFLTWREMTEKLLASGMEGSVWWASHRSFSLSASLTINPQKFITITSQVNGPWIWPLEASAVGKQIFGCFISLDEIFSPYFRVLVCRTALVFWWEQKTLIFFFKLSFLALSCFIGKKGWLSRSLHIRAETRSPCSFVIWFCHWPF